MCSALEFPKSQRFVFVRPVSFHAIFNNQTFWRGQIEWPSREVYGTPVAVGNIAIDGYIVEMRHQKIA